ncbi:MAG: hypothetical protein SOR78_05315 [Baileyella intestinalis]|uniref:hypothetical protein n=1 Tax=Baileyella intestinalis TaxID=2606709 RepID=UPI002A7544F3|nr:hypothetical protein [Baileyella intestinalis]MCI7686679.1 hypothetical protein [Clostridiales bacterium]MDY2995157.1 hypothetical protein [Baileyella intestinalis]
MWQCDWEVAGAGGSVSREKQGFDDYYCSCGLRGAVLIQVLPITTAPVGLGKQY